MSATRIFLTGATGYIGGDVLYAVHKAHPDFKYVLFVRKGEKAKAVAEQYPDAELVYGSLSDTDIIEKEAAQADIIIHTADADDIPSAEAIAKGLAAGHSKEKPGIWIHVSGTGILQWYDTTHKRSGQPPVPEEKYNDVTDINRIVNIPDQASHRDVDKVVQAANASPAVKTAIIAPPTIYASGRGPVNKTSHQVPTLIRFVLKQGYAPIFETGKTQWDNVHIFDLSDVFLGLVNAALDPKKVQNPELFGPKAYLFAENGTHLWSDVSRLVAAEAHKLGYVPDAKIRETSFQAIQDLPDITSTWSANSQCVAERAKKYLGWNPTQPSLESTIPQAIKVEAEALGLKPKQK